MQMRFLGIFGNRRLERRMRDRKIGEPAQHFDKVALLVEHGINQAGHRDFVRA
jgi:hypothetical protein